MKEQRADKHTRMSGSADTHTRQCPLTGLMVDNVFETHGKEQR